MIHKNTHKAIVFALEKLNWMNSEINFGIQVNRQLSQGEISSNIAHILAAQQKKSAQEIAKKLADNIPTKAFHLLKVQAINGYLNFFYQNSYLNQIISKILKEKKDYGRSNQGAKKRVSYESICANPTGYMHIGHLRNAIVADCLANVFAFTGYQVTRYFYNNDAGNQIFNLGKSIYFYYAQKFNLDFSDFPEMYKNAEIKKVTTAFIEKYGKKYLNLDWEEYKAGSDQEIFIDFGVQFFLKVFRDDCLKINIPFDVWFSEKSLYVGENFEKFKQLLAQKNLTYSQDGALWFKASQHGMEKDFVLVKKTGIPTYFMGDIMYHDIRFARGYDYIYNLWGTDHHGHALKVKASLKSIGWPVEKFDVDLLQMVRALHNKKIQKMSKRAGTAVYWREFVDFVGKDFARFMMISRQRTTKYVFDVSLTKEKSIKNPVFYTQYAHARAHQLLKKATKQNISLAKTFSEIGKNPAEKKLILHLYQFPSVLKRVLLKHEPQFLIDYLMEISKKFHVFYQQNPILTAEPQIAQERLALVAAFRQLSENVFRLIKVTALKSM